MNNRFKLADQFDQGVVEAHNLMAHLRSGGSLIPVQTGIRLESNEAAHSDSEVDCARFVELGNSSYRALRKSVGFGGFWDDRRLDRFEQIPVGLPGVEQ
jgi:hypothetical protein